MDKENRKLLFDKGINLINDTNFIMTYSYGRALQQSALKFWAKNIQNVKGDNY